jgi:hypothetical protein
MMISFDTPLTKIQSGVTAAQRAAPKKAAATSAAKKAK